MEIINTMSIRKRNVEKVREVLLKNNGLTKNEICLQTNLSLASCTNILKILVDSGEMRKIEDCESTGGRRAKRYYINERHELVLTIIFTKEMIREGFITKLIVADLAGHVIETIEYLANPYTDEEIINITSDLFNKYNNIKAIGISVAGIISNTDIMNSNNDIFEVDGLDKLLQLKFNVPTVIENDLNLAVLGYASGLKDDALSVVLLDYFLGAGLYLDRKVIRGENHFAGEIAYFPCMNHHEKYRYSSSKPKEHIEFFINICLAYITLINPSIISISGFNKDAFEVIEQEVCKRIPQRYCPKFDYIGQKDNYILQGIIHLTLSLLK